MIGVHNQSIQRMEDLDSSSMDVCSMCSGGTAMEIADLVGVLKTENDFCSKDVVLTAVDMIDNGRTAVVENNLLLCVNVAVFDGDVDVIFEYADVEVEEVTSLDEEVAVLDVEGVAPRVEAATSTIVISPVSSIS